MWPYFWLKAAAARLDDSWHLCVFSLAGQWSDIRQAVPVDQPTDALAVVSKRLDAASAWGMMDSLAATNTIEVAEGITATVPEVYASTSVVWQEPYAFVPELMADVAEPATWRYFFAGSQVQWLSDSAQRLRMDAAIRPTLDYLSEVNFESFISARFAGQRPPRGNFPSVDTFNYSLDLPLALRMNVGAYLPGAKSRQIELDCHAPLRLDELAITEGDIPGPSALPVEQDAAAEGGWALGHVSVPPTASRLRIRSPQLGRVLAYDFSVPTREELVANIVSYVYAPHDATERGTEKWSRDALDGSDAAFEVALLNALARFGIPVLFAGQFKTPDGQMGGTATPGFDLVALDFRNRRAVAISAKGTEKLPAREQLDNLRQAVRELGGVLSGWMVFGLVACHAPPRDFASWRDRPADLNVWGREQLAHVLHASTAHAIAGLLWVPPWASETERWLYPVVP